MAGKKFYVVEIHYNGPSFVLQELNATVSIQTAPEYSEKFDFETGQFVKYVETNGHVGFHGRQPDQHPSVVDAYESNNIIECEKYVVGEFDSLKEAEEVVIANYGVLKRILLSSKTLYLPGGHRVALYSLKS